MRDREGKRMAVAPVLSHWQPVAESESSFLLLYDERADPESCSSSKESVFDRPERYLLFPFPCVELG